MKNETLSVPLSVDMLVGSVHRKSDAKAIVEKLNAKFNLVPKTIEKTPRSEDISRRKPKIRKEGERVSKKTRYKGVSYDEKRRKWVTLIWKF